MTMMGFTEFYHLLITGLILVCDLDVVSGAIVFTSSNNAVAVPSGTSVTMQWTYLLSDGTGVFAVRVQRMGNGSAWTSVLTGGPTTTHLFVPNFPRYNATQDIASPVVVKFTINNVMCSDGGQFRLSFVTNGVGASNEVDSDQDVIRLTIQVLPTGNPTVVAPSPATGQVLAEDQSVTFTCSGHLGSPTGTFEWTREKSGKTASMPSGATLVVNDNDDGCSKDGTSTLPVVLSKEDNGASYKCTTKANPSLAPVSLSAASRYLNVAYGVAVSPKTQSISVVKTQSATLTCNADGNPAPAYSWTMGGQTLPETTNTYTIQADAMAVPKNLIYVCMASNTLNGVDYNVSKTFSVSITEQPASTEAPTTTQAPTTPVPSKSTISIISDKSTDDNKIDMAVVGGAVGGGVAFLILVVVIVVVCMKMKKPKPTPEGGGQDTDPENSYSEHKNNAHENEYMDDSKPDLIGGNNFDSPKHRNVEGIVYADLALDNRARSRMPIQAPAPSPTEYAEIQRRP